MSSSELEYFPQDDEYDYEQHFAPSETQMSYKYIAPTVVDAGGNAVSKEMVRVRKGEIEKPLAMMSEEERALFEELDADFEADEEGECDEDFENMIEAIIPREQAGPELARDIHWRQNNKDETFFSLSGGFDQIMSKLDRSSMDGSCNSDEDCCSVPEGDENFDEVMAAYDSDSQGSSGDLEAEVTTNNDIKELNEYVKSTKREGMIDPQQVRIDGETKQKILANVMHYSSTESEPDMDSDQEPDGPPIHHRIAKPLGNLPKGVNFNRSIKQSAGSGSNKISSDMFDFKP